MNYFDYQVTGTMGRIWSLFEELGSLSEEEKLGKSQLSCEYSHTLEIVNSALKGSLPTDTESLDAFNLKAYEFKCAQNDKLNKEKRGKKYLSLVSDTTERDDERTSPYTISERKFKCIEESFEFLENLDNFESSMMDLCNIRDEYIRDKGIDIVSILSSGLKGIPEAVSQIKDLISSNSRLRDLVVSLCEDSSNGALISRLAMVL